MSWQEVKEGDRIVFVGTDLEGYAKADLEILQNTVGIAIDIDWFELDLFFRVDGRQIFCLLTDVDLEVEDVKQEAK